jgi:hypothetical protein
MASWSRSAIRSISASSEEVPCIACAGGAATDLLLVQVIDMKVFPEFTPCPPNSLRQGKVGQVVKLMPKSMR